MLWLYYCGESLPHLTVQWVEPDLFDRQGWAITYAFTLSGSVVATSTAGYTDINPVGCTIAASVEAFTINEGLQQQGAISVACLKIVLYLSGCQGEDVAGQIGYPYPGQDQKTTIIEDQFTSSIALFLSPQNL